MREIYANPSFEVLGLDDLQAEDWQRFEATMKPNADSGRALGHYAVDTRKRLRGAVPDRPAGAARNTHEDEARAKHGELADVLAEDEPA